MTVSYPAVSVGEVLDMECVVVVVNLAVFDRGGGSGDFLAAGVEFDEGVDIFFVYRNIFFSVGNV